MSCYLSKALLPCSYIVEFYAFKNALVVGKDTSQVEVSRWKDTFGRKELVSIKKKEQV